MRILIAIVMSFLISEGALSTKAIAQGALTVGAVQSALVEALNGMRAALNEATYDAKSVGNSYQANAQNVLSDLNTVLGSKLTYTFDRLNDQEKSLAQSAERLVAITKEATDELTKKNFQRARTLMVEGDIVAYNTSYSLPCRTATPRVMLVEPVEIDADAENPIIHLRGNFLLQGKDLSVQIGKQAAKIAQRTDTEIAFEVPRSTLDAAKQKQTSVSGSINGLVSLNRKIRFILGCSEKAVPLPGAPTVQFLINPPISYRVSGTLVTTHLVDKVVADLTGKFSRTGNNQCDDSFSVDQNFCLVDKTGTFHHIDITNQSANCSSSIGPVNPSGDRCVFVGGHVAGCGANRGLFNTWLGCKGRGWVSYDYQLWRKDRIREEASRSAISKEGIVGETVFSFAFPGAVSEPQYNFSLTVEKIRGDKILERKTLSDAAPTSGTWQASVKDGAISVVVQ